MSTTSSPGKHTAGPWRPVGSTVLDPEGRLLALVYGRRGAGVEAGLEQAQVDARLIAAAPALHGAARIALAAIAPAIDATPAGTPGRAGLKAAERILRDALARACAEATT